MTLELCGSVPTQLHRSTGVCLSLRIRAGESLRLKLSTHNSVEGEPVFSEGLQTYWQVCGISFFQLHGLPRAQYSDLLQGNLRCQQTGAISLGAERGRMRVNILVAYVIEDSSLHQRNCIEKSGSLSAAVWKLWSAMAAIIDELGPWGRRKIVCLGSVNALENLVTLPPVQSQSLPARYSVQSMALVGLNGSS